MGVSGLRKRPIDGGSCRVIPCFSSIQQVIEVVRHQNRALGVASGEDQKLVDRITSLQAISREQRFYVVCRLVDRQGREIHWPSLTVERSLIFGEQGPHQGRLASCEYIRSGLPMVLDHRAKQPIEVVIRDQQILELIEADHRHPSIDLVQLRGDIEQLEKGSSCLVYG